ncbi:MAG: hypothetical protein AAFZ18_23450 [Myxococcota bacterium]
MPDSPIDSSPTRIRPLILALAATAAVGAGCNNVSTSVFVEGILAPIDPIMCGFDSESETFYSRTILDLQSGGNPNARKSLALRAKFFNAMAADAIEVESDPMETFSIPNQVTPVRFDFQWECDSNGFNGGAGPLVLPQFSVTRPFCFDQRDDTGDFIGFDQVSASGPVTEPQGNGLATFRPIPPELGLAFDEVFQLAELANACCDELGANCFSGVGANVTPGGTNACAQLQATFDTFGEGLRVDSGNPQQASDLNRWQPFSIYTANTAPIVAGAYYTMRIRGEFEFITASGSNVVSNELLHDIGICRGCGFTSACTD